MHILTLSIQVQKTLVRAHCVRFPEPKHSGGMIVTVYPGGSFHGLSFDALVKLGSGRHEVTECDERDISNLGQEHEYPSAREAKLAWFEGILFGYQQGTYTSLEVLHASERVLEVFGRGTK